MLTVHHLGASQSDRIVWLCEELGIPYELIRYERDPVTRMAPENYKALHPAGTAPVITDGDLALAESCAILEYIVARHGNGRFVLTVDDPEYSDYLYWYHVGNGTMMPMFFLLLSGGQFAPVAQDRITKSLQAMDAHLGAGRSWLAGDQFTIADIVMLYPLAEMREFVSFDLTPYPNVRAYLKRIADRPALKSTLRKADPDLHLKLD